MKKMHPVQQSFLKKSLALILSILLFIILTASCVYYLMLNALQEEVEAMNLNTAYEFKVRLEDIIEESNHLASKLVTAPYTRLFFTHQSPDILVDDYHETLYRQMMMLQNTYLSSIVLYAPKFDHVLFDSSSSAYTLSGLSTENAAFDVSWIDCLDDADRTTTRLFVRAKNEQWPYYLTMIKHYRSGSVDGVAVINIDLIKLHDSLVSSEQDHVQLFLVNAENQVIVQKDKTSLFVPVSEFDSLASFKQGETFSSVDIDGDSGFAYMQVYSEKYDMTCVTVTQLSDYVMHLSQIRHQFLIITSIAAILAIIFAVMYSFHIRRPLQDLRALLADAENNSNSSDYAEEIRDIADQIISHLQTNSTLNQELDARLHLLKDTQMLALQAQINPHFLFNTLNVISMMVESECGDGHVVVQMLSDLSALLRYSLSEHNTVRLEEEITYVERYLSITKYRYENITVSIDVDPDIKGCTVPRFAIQPLIENALQHGLSSGMCSRPGALRLHVYGISHMFHNKKLEKAVCIDVSDNGVGIPEETLEILRSSLTQHDTISSSHIGLANVSHRFYLLFHTEQQITIDSIWDRGTTVRIVFPAIPFTDPT